MAEIKKWQTDQKCTIKILDSDDPEDIKKYPKCKRCGHPHLMVILKVIPVPKLEEVPDLLTQLINSGVTV